MRLPNASTAAPNSGPQTPPVNPARVQKQSPPSTATNGAKAKVKAAPTKPALNLSLPTEPNAPLTSINEAALLFYGDNMTGKSSLAARFPAPFFLMTTPRFQAFGIFVRLVGSWEEFKGYIDLLIKSDEFKTLVLDTAQDIYEMCVDYVCEQNNVNDPGDLSWGDGWKAVNKEFKHEITRFTSLGRGVIFLGHTEIAEIEPRTGRKYNMIAPRLSKQARLFLKSFVDVTGFLGYYGEDRYITILGNDHLDAGNRLQEVGRFFTPAGEPIYRIPMGANSQEAFDNLVKAFNNEQAESCRLDRPEQFVEMKEKRAVKKGR